MSEKTKELLKKLEDGVKNVFESDKYKDYLRFLSRFHRYSAGNCLLIAAQCPEATFVASYTGWQKQKRQVVKNAKSIKILAPHTYKEETDTEGDEENVKTGFHCASVFDISQTYSPSGDPVPSPVRILSDSVCNFDNLLNILLHKVSPVPVSFETINGEANGYFSHTENRIVIKEDLPELQTIKTLIHEIAHSILHAKGSDGEKSDRETKEVQAESIAYCVCEALGLDVSDYSFGYIATWSKDRSLPELRASLDTIRTVSDKLISEIEEEVMYLHDMENEERIE